MTAKVCKDTATDRTLAEELRRVRRDLIDPDPDDVVEFHDLCRQLIDEREILATELESIRRELELVNIPRRSFFHLRRAGQLPMCQELKLRLGHTVRYRAALIERYLAGDWGQPRSFASHRKFQ